uniref:C2H2-type domain-containing protein n=1 Tax=viral metagenome TaxID=1070528 RepID=A0A6M3LMN4_9ZZZZ
MAEPPMSYTAERGRVRIWTCSLCGKRFEWKDEPGAEWLGSHKHLDDYDWKRITIVCSAKCKEKARE